LTKKRKGKPHIAPQGDATAKLAGLIQEKKTLATTDGALQVALAIASVTTLVTVDSTQDPFVVDPEDLGTLTFGDPKVGLSDEQVAILKANLKVLLPQISKDIEKIPENASLVIGDVAEFVRVSLLSPDK
jgi:hypothetical protein